MVRRSFTAAWRAVDGASFQLLGQRRREQKVINANAAIGFKGLAKVVPVGVLAGGLGVQGAEGVDVAQAEQGTVGGAGFGLKERVADPAGGLVAVDVFGDDVVVTGDDGGFGEPTGHGLTQAFHPAQLVLKLVSTDGIAVGQIDIDYANRAGWSGDAGFEKAGLGVGLIAGQSISQQFNGVARKDSYAVVALLAEIDVLIAEVFKDCGRELQAFKLLQQKGIRLVRLEPGCNGRKPGFDGVDVPAGDLDGGLLRTLRFRCLRLASRC